MGKVCDLEGRVSGHPQLYVVDGALLPGSSTCTNPALNDRRHRRALLGTKSSPPI